tara:strand:+ start:147 stop:320 length:174 start_codon:yes stop_codon:yes gene_type:complete
MFTFFAPIIITLSAFMGLPKNNSDMIILSTPTIDKLGTNTDIIYKKAPLNLVKPFNK